MVEEIMTQISNFFMAHKGIAMIVNFLAKHANFILGIIINLILISVFCKVTDAFNYKVEKRLLKKQKIPAKNKMASTAFFSFPRSCSSSEAKTSAKDSVTRTTPAAKYFAADPIFSKNPRSCLPVLQSCFLIFSPSFHFPFHIFSDSHCNTLPRGELSKEERKKIIFLSPLHILEKKKGVFYEPYAYDSKRNGCPEQHRPATKAYPVPFLLQPSHRNLFGAKERQRLRGHYPAARRNASCRRSGHFLRDGKAFPYAKGKKALPRGKTLPQARSKVTKPLIFLL